MKIPILNKEVENIILDDFIDEIFTPEFTLKNLSNYGVTARNLQYWQEHDLLPNKQRKTDENHKFNFVELIWIQIICELRSFRFPLTKIRNVKNSLFLKRTVLEFLGYTEGDNTEEIIFKIFPQLRGQLKKKITHKELSEMLSGVSKYEKIPMLGLILYDFVMERRNHKILVYNTGEIGILTSDNSSMAIEAMKANENRTYFSISILKLMSQFTNDIKHMDYSLNYHLLTKSELEVLLLVKLNKFDSVKVHIKNGEPFILEATENIKVSKETRLSEILLNGGYEQLEIKTKDGVIAFSPKTTKYFL